MAKTNKTPNPKTKTKLSGLLIGLHWNRDGKTLSGRCSEKGCKNERTVKPQDAFQVSRCTKCQKKNIYKRIAARRKAKRAAAK